MNHERFEILLMKSVDGLLDDAERSELDAHLETCATCRAEHRDFAAIKGATDTMTERILADARLEPIRESSSTRFVLGTGFFLMLVGTVILLGFAAYTLATAPDIPPVLKLGLLLASVGAAVLFGYLLRIRLRARGKDPYEEIDL